MLLCPVGVHAQFSAQLSATSDRGCNTFTVTIIDESGAPSGEIRNYNYGAGETLDTFFTFTSPGVYEITQTIQNADPRRASIFVEVIAPESPRSILANCQGTEAFVYANDDFYPAYWVDWGDGNTGQVSPGDLLTHDYGVLGTFNVTVKGLMDPAIPDAGLANLNCLSTTRQLTLTSAFVPAEINRVEVLNDDSIRLNYTLEEGFAYIVEMSTDGSTAFTALDTISSDDFASEYIVNNLDAGGSFYCFRITVFDPCSGASMPSETACSVVLTVAAENNQNRLNWSTESTDLQAFSIDRDSNIVASTVASEYIDADVTCGVEYCYRIVMSENNGLESLSQLVCETAFSTDTPPAIRDVSASVEDNIVVLDWEALEPAPAYYRIRKSQEGGEGFSTFQLDENTFSDTDSRPDRHRYTYRLAYENLCGNLSPETVVSPVFLSKETNTAILWTGYLGWENGPRGYILQKFSVDGELLDEVDMGLNGTFEETDFENLPQQVMYRVVALPADFGLPDVYSNFFTLTFPSFVVFPNSFTPNGDGLNDAFNFKGKYIIRYRLTIFTRWGELIFETDDPDEGWGGVIRSQPAPSDVYIFNAEFEDEMGREFSKTGEIYLLR